MSKKKTDLTPPVEEAAVAVKQPKKKKKKKSGLFGRIVRRFFLLVFTAVVLVVVALCLLLNVIFNGPSPAAREVLTMSLLEPSGTKWIPGLFLEEDVLKEIVDGVEATLPAEVSGTGSVIINSDGALSGESNEFANYPDGIYIEKIGGDTYTAYVMLVQDPSRVSMGLSSQKFSESIPGKRLSEVMTENPDVIASINAGAFYDDGSANSIVGSVPAGLVVAGGQVVWNAYHGLVPETGFVGFNQDNILVVAQSMTAEKAMELNIRDGCEFGPVLIMDGVINEEVYNSASGWNPRTAIGQRADGTVVMVAVEGRQFGSAGATYADVINIMVEYGAVNACNMDGGSSTVMMYRDTEGRYADEEEYARYGANGDVIMLNNYSLLQSLPRRMPNYWMVRATSEE